MSENPTNPETRRHVIDVDDVDEVVVRATRKPAPTPFEQPPPQVYEFAATPIPRTVPVDRPRPAAPPKQAPRWKLAMAIIFPALASFGGGGVVAVAVFSSNAHQEHPAPTIPPTGAGDENLPECTKRMIEWLQSERRRGWTPQDKTNVEADIAADRAKYAIPGKQVSKGAAGEEF